MPRRSPYPDADDGDCAAEDAGAAGSPAGELGWQQTGNRRAGSRGGGEPNPAQPDRHRRIRPGTGRRRGCRTDAVLRQPALGNQLVRGRPYGRLERLRPARTTILARLDGTELADAIGRSTGASAARPGRAVRQRSGRRAGTGPDRAGQARPAPAGPVLLLGRTPGEQRTPRVPARACLSLLPSGPGEVHRMRATRGVWRPVYWPQGVSCSPCSGSRPSASRGAGLPSARRQAPKAVAIPMNQTRTDQVGTDHVGQVMHAERDPGEADQQHHDRRHRYQPGPANGQSRRAGTPPPGSRSRRWRPGCARSGNDLPAATATGSARPAGPVRPAA